jgi:hypothetical protein
MMRPRRHSAFRPQQMLLALAGTAALAMAGGCSVINTGPGGVLTLSGADGTHKFAPDYSTAAYKSIDADTFDVFLSDLPRERLTNSSDLLGGTSGNLVHVHIFLTPDAGNTPIDSTACNFTVRHLVIAGGTNDAPVMGLYAGGGFLATSGAILGGGINGAVSAASERLHRSTPGFKDLLGSASLSGRFSASEDEHLADALSAKFELLVSRLPAAVKQEAKPAPKKADPAKADNKGSDKKSGKAGEKDKSSKDDADAKPAK